MDKIKLMEEYALHHNVPIIQKPGLEFLLETLKKYNSQTILEVGSAIGYSAINMAMLDKVIKIDTIERNEKMYKKAKQNISDCHLNDQINIYFDDALLISNDTLRLGHYDCIFIDAAKAQYQKFFNKYEPLLNEGGIIITDNLYFHGFVDQSRETNNRNTKQLVRKINNFREWLFNHPDYITEYYEIGDGIAITRRK